MSFSLGHFASQSFTSGQDPHFSSYLRNVLQLIHEKKAVDEKITGHFIRCFREWGAEHGEFMEKSPLLKSLAGRIERDNPKNLSQGWTGWALSLLSSFAPAVGSDVDPRRAGIETAIMERSSAHASLTPFLSTQKQLSIEEFLLILDHVELGTVKAEDVAHFFRYLDLSFLYHPDRLERIAQRIEKMSPSVIFSSLVEIRRIMLTAAPQRQTLMCVSDPVFLKTFIKALHKLDHKQLTSILKGGAFLQDRELFDLLCPLLQTLRPLDIALCFCDIPSEFDKDLAVEFFKNLPHDVIIDVLACEPKEPGVTLLHHPHLLHSLQPILQDLDSDTLFSLLNKKNGSLCVPLHHIDLTLILPVLNVLHPKQLFSLLRAVDDDRETPFSLHFFDGQQRHHHYIDYGATRSYWPIESFPKLFPLFQKMEEDDQIALMDQLHSFFDQFPMHKKLFLSCLQELASTTFVKMIFSEKMDPFFRSEDFLDLLWQKLEELPPQDIKDILIRPLSLSGCLLHSSYTFKKSISLDRYGDSYEHICADRVLPLLKKLSAEDLLDILCFQNDVNQQTFFHIHERDLNQIEYARLLEHVDDRGWQRLLSLENHQAKPLIYSEFLLGVVQNTKAFSIELARWILSFTCREGRTILHKVECLRFAIKTLEHVAKEDYVRVIGKQDLFGNTPMHDPEIASQLFNFFIRIELDSDILFQLLTIENRSGHLPIHHVGLCQKIVPALEKLDPNFALRVLLEKDREGNTAFHQPRIIPLAASIISQFNIDLSTYKNIANISPLDEVLLSQKWLTSAKFYPEFATAISHAEYMDRIAAASLTARQMFDELIFSDEGGVNPELLFLEKSYRGQKSRDCIENQRMRVRSSLEIMLKRMTFKEAWLGTPKADQPEALAMFYLEMLINLEKVIGYLKEVSDLEERAGTLVQLASVEMETRCAAGYQAETRQIAQICQWKQGTGNLTLDDLIQGGLHAALMKMIDHIFKNPRHHFRNDSHILTHLLFAAGLVPNDDPLISISVADTRALIQKEFSYQQFFSFLRESLPSEYIEDFLRKQIPVDYDCSVMLTDGTSSSYQQFNERCLSEERKLLEDLHRNIQSLGLGEGSEQALLKLFQTFRSMTLGSLSHLLNPKRGLKDNLRAIVMDKKAAFAKQSFARQIEKTCAEKNLETNIENLETTMNSLDQTMEDLKIEPSCRTKILKFFINYQDALVALSQLFPQDTCDGDAFYYSFHVSCHKNPSEAVAIARQMKYMEHYAWPAAQMTKLLEIIGVVEIKP
jgi:hypothetical protein